MLLVEQPDSSYVLGVGVSEEEGEQWEEVPAHLLEPTGSSSSADSGMESRVEQGVGAGMVVIEMGGGGGRTVAQLDGVPEAGEHESSHT